MGTGLQAKAAPLRPVVATFAGDHQVNETKLNAIVGTTELRPMTPEELEIHIGGPAGFLGPVGIAEVMTGGSLNGLNSGKDLNKIRAFFAIFRLKALRPSSLWISVFKVALPTLVAGANKLDYHYRNITPMRDFQPTLVADVRSVNEGEPDLIAGDPLRIGKGG